MTDDALLDRATIEAALDAAGEGPLLIALSGGGDSTALLHLLTERVGAPRLAAAIVDHALRDGSDAEAEQARARAAALGVAVVVVRLDWPNGRVLAQQTARERRYAALCAEARCIGARVLLAGHTRDDQAETVLMRARAKSGWRGLAAMRAIAPMPFWPEGRGLTLARPLLQARRGALRDYLRARGAVWSDDPSNENTAFARVRARARLAELEAEGVETVRLARLAERVRPLVDKLDREAGALIGEAARFEAGRILVSQARWRGGRELRRRALSALIAAAAGAAREPHAGAVARLEEGRAEAGFRGATLGGAVIAPAAGGFRLSRDTGALVGRAGVAPAAALPLPVGAEAVWDGRLALLAAEAGWAAACGEDGETPVLRRGETVLSLADAEACGLVSASWLLAEHAAHVLAVHTPLRAPVA
jgi:tRNA(Ile)-lysidine synthase